MKHWNEINYNNNLMKKIDYKWYTFKNEKNNNISKTFTKN